MIDFFLILKSMTEDYILLNSDLFFIFSNNYYLFSITVVSLYFKARLIV